MVDERRTPVRFYDEGISAGFSSPAKDYEERRLHLTMTCGYQTLRNHIPCQSQWRLTVTGAGINDGDILVVDRGLNNYLDKIVITCINNKNTVKRYKIERGRHVLMPKNKYSDIYFS